MRDKATSSQHSVALAPAEPFGTPDTDGWTQRVGGLAALPDVLRELGADPAVLLARAGLPPDALVAPEQRAPFGAVLSLLADAARETGCAHLGLLVGQRWRIAVTGLAGDLAWCSETVQQALETFTVYHRLNSTGGAATFTRLAHSALLGFAVLRWAPRPG